MNFAKIYVLKEPHTGDIRYVGKTINSLDDRLVHHLNEKTKCHRVNWLNMLKANGLTPIIEQVAVVNEFEWAKAERTWVKYFKGIGCKLVNGTIGGDGGTGHKHSEETKAKLRIASIKQFSNPAARMAASMVHSGKKLTPVQSNAMHVGRKTSWDRFRADGLSISDETKAKISKANKGKIRTDEYKAKVSSQFKGIKKTPEHRAKLAEHCRKITKLREANRLYNSFMYEI